MNLATPTRSSHTPSELIKTAVQLFSTRRFDEVETPEISAIAGFDSCRDPFRCEGKEDIYAAAGGVRPCSGI